MKSFRDLEIYQESKRLAIEVHKFIQWVENHIE